MNADESMRTMERGQDILLPALKTLHDAIHATGNADDALRMMLGAFASLHALSCTLFGTEATDAILRNVESLVERHPELFKK